MITYKRKLNLSKIQEDRLSSWIGTCRFVYNMGMQIKKESWKNKQENISAYDLMNQLTEIKDYDWISDVPSQSLQNSLERLDRSKIKTATIIKEPTGFFICIVCDEVVKSISNPDESQVIGIDMGVANFCVDSNGNLIENPRHFKKYEDKLRVENRSLSRKKKFSNRWKKQAKKLSLLHHKIANVRKDFLHKESTIMAKKYHTVYLEDLNIKNMSKNKNLSKHILDCGWGMFRIMLEYKTNVVRVNPKYTSQTCNECGKKDAKSRLSQSEFVCISCGHVSHADVNAAKNIMSKGIALNRKRDSLECALVEETCCFGTSMSAKFNRKFC